MRRLTALAFALAVFTATAPATLWSAPTGANVAQVPIDESRAAAAGIRKLAGRHLVLYTDVPSGPEVDALPALFDAAVPLWAADFGVDLAQTDDWRVQAFLIRDRDRFAALQLMPADRDLVNGYASAANLWVIDQPSDYYRRHLLLHEGTHAFMTTFLGGCGPGWYSEGMAELLATHRMGAGGRGQGAGGNDNSKLELKIMPRSRDEVPMLGRIKLVHDAVAAGDALSIDAILAIDGQRQQEPQAYAWCWALAKFLDSHPRYRDKFHDFAAHVRDPDFNARVKEAYESEWPELTAEWEAYVHSLDHGYNFERMAIEFEPGSPFTSQRQVEVAADRGWQSTGIALQAGTAYRIRARGRYQIALEDGKPWPCEAGGVTIEYYGGKPLGVLLGAIVPESDAARPAEADLAAPFAIGLERGLAPKTSGTLYLRVNDSPAKLGDNRGRLTIEVEPR
jgi:hypothetical protein